MGEACGGREGRGEDRGSLRGVAMGPETTWGSITVPFVAEGRVWMKEEEEDEERGGRGGRGMSTGPELGPGTLIIRTGGGLGDGFTFTCRPVATVEGVAVTVTPGVVVMITLVVVVKVALVVVVMGTLAVVVAVTECVVVLFVEVETTGFANVVPGAEVTEVTGVTGVEQASEEAEF